MTDTTTDPVDGGALPAVPQTNDPGLEAIYQKASVVYFLNLRLRVQ